MPIIFTIAQINCQLTPLVFAVYMGDVGLFVGDAPKGDVGLLIGDSTKGGATYGT